MTVMKCAGEKIVEVDVIAHINNKSRFGLPYVDLFLLERHSGSTFGMDLQTGNQSGLRFYRVLEFLVIQGLRIYFRSATAYPVGSIFTKNV